MQRDVPSEVHQVGGHLFLWQVEEVEEREVVVATQAQEEVDEVGKVLAQPADTGDRVGQRQTQYLAVEVSGLRRFPCHVCEVIDTEQAQAGAGRHRWASSHASPPLRWTL